MPEDPRAKPEACPSLAPVGSELAGLLSTAVYQADHGLVITDGNGKILYVNAAFVRMTGYTREEAIGRNPSILKSGKQDPSFYQSLWQTIKAGKTWRGDLINQRKNGSTYLESMSISPVFNSAAEIVGFIGCKEDVTVRRAAEQAQNFLAAIVKSSHFAIIGTNREGLISVWNLGAENIFGYRADEAVGNPLGLIVPADRAQEAGAIFESLAKGHEIRDFETTCVAKDGHTVDLLFSVSSIRDVRGEIVGTATVGRDISARKGAERTLRASEQKFRELAENISEVFWMTDAPGSEILYVSPSYEQVWERRCEDLYRNPMAWLEAIEHEDRERAHETFLKQLKGEQVDSEYRIRTPAGGVKWIRDRAFAIRNAAGDIVRIAGVAEDISASKQAEADLAYQAMHDPLTGLPNRLLLADRLGADIEAARTLGLQLAVMYVDLDGFKFVNDSLGHEVGDELLQQVARRLQGCTREGDTLARMGGDEFMLVFNGIKGDPAALEIAERLRSALRKSFVIAGRELYVTASIGIAMFPRHGDKASELRCNADAAMYDAKKSGKDRVQVFSHTMQDEVAEHLELENALRRSLDRDDGLSVMYQPIFDVQGGRERQTAFEALLRWRHPARGAVPPSQFIPLAEESGLILRLGAWVLKRACRECRLWQDRGFDGVRVAVNVSALEFARPEFVDHVLGVLDQTGLAGSLLDLEITESSLLLGLDEAIRKLHLLRAHGVHFSIDDFGTGYSSLGYLPRLPVDTLKIDRSFVAALEGNASNRSLVEGIIELAHRIGLRTIVEGVETREQLEILRNFGCDEAQGFLLGRPAGIPMSDEANPGATVDDSLPVAT